MAGDSGVGEWLESQGYETRRPIIPGKNHDECHFRAVVKVKVQTSRPFYEAAVLLDSLNEIYWENLLTREYEPRQSSIISKDPSTRDFINKLCQFCDNQVGGATVTACALLEYEDCIEYRFASNQLSDGQLQEVTQFITEVLKTLQKARPTRLDLIRSQLLQQVVMFCRKKIQAYITALVKQISDCVESQDCNRSVLYELEMVQSLSIEADDRNLDQDSFFKRCETLMNHLDILSNDEIASFILDKAKRTHMPRPQNCWAGLRHSSGRLLSYIRATKTLVVTQLSWSSLGKPVKVRFLPSSKPDHNPLINDVNRTTVSAESILGKMTGDVHLRKQYQSAAQELQKQGLDGLIQQRVKADGFRPQVHAEVLILQSLEQEGLVLPTRFFNHDAYIGASKPTCKLCHWYFHLRNNGPEVRPTHHNFYPRWKLPDICQCEGEAIPRLTQDRVAMLKNITESIRSEALEVIDQKASKGKVHDSNTDPTFLVPSLGDGEPADVDEESHLESPDSGVVLLERERRPYGSGNASS